VLDSDGIDVTLLEMIDLSPPVADNGIIIMMKCLRKPGLHMLPNMQL